MVVVVEVVTVVVLVIEVVAAAAFYCALTLSDNEIMKRAFTLSTVMVFPCNSVLWRWDIHLAASSLVDIVTSPKH